MSTVPTPFKNFKGSHIYDGNHAHGDSILFKCSAKSNAYLQSQVMYGKEVKVQDFLFKSDPSLPPSSQNINPIFSYKTGVKQGQVVGNSLDYKEVILKVHVYMDIPPQSTILLQPSDIPDFFIHYALIYSDDEYNGTDPEPNYLQFAQVFNDVSAFNQETTSNAFSFKSISGSDKYKVLLESTLHLGQYNPCVAKNVGQNPPVVLPQQNSPPFSQYFNYFINLWDKNMYGEGQLETNLTMDDKVVFSSGLPCVCKVNPESEGKVVNDIVTGSLWVVFDITPGPSNTQEYQPTFEYYTRVAYTDSS